MKINENINLKRLYSVLKKNIIIIIMILFMFVLCGYFYSYNMITPKYRSTSTILLASNSESLTQTEIALNKSLVSTYGKILTSNNVLEQVISNLNLDITKEQLYQNIQITEIEDTQIIQVTVIDNNPAEAQKIAEELNRVFVEEIKEIYKIDNITIVDKASFEPEPYNINHGKDIFIFLAVGIVCSIIYSTIIYFLDTTIKVEEDIEEFIRLNVVGTIPKHERKHEEELIVQNDNKSVITEALKAIRTNLSFIKVKGDSKSILFTSCNFGEGKSWIASNMAVAYAQSNKNVIIVDADMRKGRQHKIFDVQNINGLSNCLTEIKNNEEFYKLQKYIRETSIPKVHIMPIGLIPPNPSELLLSNKMEYLIQMLKCVYDIVIVDGTPCNLVSDSIPVSRIVDASILVVESKRTKIEDLGNVVKSIQNAEGNLVGAILNKKEIKKKAYGKGYYYGDIDNNSKIELTSYTVKELLNNKKEYIKDTESVQEKPENEKLEILTEKIEKLENKLLEIPELNSKIIDEVKKTYANEINKNKLAEDIKEKIVNNEVANKLEQNLTKKIQQLDYTEVLNSLVAKVENYNEKIEQLDNSETLNNIANEIESLKQLDNSVTLNNIANEIESLKQLDNSETLNNIANEIEQLKKLGDKKLISALLTQIKNLNKKYKKIDEIEQAIINNKTEENLTKLIDNVKDDNTRLLKQMDNARQIKKIMKEMKKINRKYDVLLEKITNKQTTQSTVKERKNIFSRNNLNNIIELDKVKEKSRKQELIIEYGEEISYENLLDLAVETYNFTLDEGNILKLAK